MSQKCMVVLPARLGDSIFCTPSIAFLKKHLPELIIDLLAPTPISAAVFQHNPWIRKIYVTKKPEEILNFRDDYDFAVNLHRDSLTDAAIDALSLPTWQVGRPNKMEHQAEQALAMLGLFLHQPIITEDRCYRLFPQESDKQKVRDLLEAQGVDFSRTKLIGFHLGCRGIAKKAFWRTRASVQHRKVWPLKKFIELAKILEKAHPEIRIVITGSGTESILAREFVKKIPSAINLVDQTSILETVSLMSLLKVYVTADTGPMHLASSTLVPMVALFGPTEVVRFGPYPPAATRIVVQEAATENVAVDKVYEAMSRFIF